MRTANWALESIGDEDKGIASRFESVFFCVNIYSDGYIDVRNRLACE